MPRLRSPSCRPTTEGSARRRKSSPATATAVVYAHVHSAGLARQVRGARLTTLEGVGHAPHHVAPDRIADIIVEAERRATAAATLYVPTVAMRRLLVPPTVPNGTPATTMMRSPGPAKPSI